MLEKDNYYTKNITPYYTTVPAYNEIMFKEQRY